MKNYIILGIYLIGCILAYFLFRYRIEGWTVGDRFIALVMSSMSWVVVLVAIVIIGIEKIKINWDKKAKW